AQDLCGVVVEVQGEQVTACGIEHMVPPTEAEHKVKVKILVGKPVDHRTIVGGHGMAQDILVIQCTQGGRGGNIRRIVFAEHEITAAVQIPLDQGPIRLVVYRVSVGRVH